MLPVLDGAEGQVFHEVGEALLFPPESSELPTSTTLAAATSGRLSSFSTTTRIPDGRSTVRTSH